MITASFTTMQVGIPNQRESKKMTYQLTLQRIARAEHIDHKDEPLHGEDIVVQSYPVPVLAAGYPSYTCTALLSLHH